MKITFPATTEQPHAKLSSEGLLTRGSSLDKLAAGTLVRVGLNTSCVFLLCYDSARGTYFLVSADDGILQSNSNGCKLYPVDAEVIVKG